MRGLDFHSYEGEKLPEWVKICNPKEWLPSSPDISINEKAYFCLDHWINSNHLWKDLNILEVWPLPISEYEYGKKTAPISLFKSELPDNNYLWIGWHIKDDESTSDFMWDVDFIWWYIDSKRLEFWIDWVLEYFNWPPDIIYWRHVFENSPSWDWTFPLWTYWMLDWVAKLMKEEWYLIIDNAFWNYNSVLKWSEKYSKHLKLVAVYYNEDNWIYIYQKPIGIDELASKELEWEKNKHIYYDLLKRKKKIEWILSNLSIEDEGIERSIIKINWKIEKLKIQTLKLKKNEKEIEWKDQIIYNLEELIKNLYIKLDLFYKRLKDLPSKIKEKEGELIWVKEEIDKIKVLVDSIL